MKQSQYSGDTPVRSTVDDTTPPSNTHQPLAERLELTEFAIKTIIRSSFSWKGMWGLKIRIWVFLPLCWVIYQLLFLVDPEIKEIEQLEINPESTGKGGE